MSEILAKAAKDVLRGYYQPISQVDQDSESQPFGLLQAAQERKQVSSRGIDVKIRREEEQERATWEAWELPPAPKPAFDLARWKERDYAETTRWEREQSYQRYRQGEREYSQPTTQPQRLMFRTSDWVK